MPRKRDLDIIIALYERLSKDDKLQGKSNSISKQKEILKHYAERTDLLISDFGLKTD